MTMISPPNPSSGQPPCPVCHFVNRPGVLVCQNCGHTLVYAESTGSTRTLEKHDSSETFVGKSPEELLGQKLEAEAKLTEEATSVARSVYTAGAEAFTADMRLRVEIEGAPSPLTLSIQREAMIGRHDTMTGVMPDIDLTAYAGYRMGVSRQHALLRLQNERLEVVDLGSSNGTAVNGSKLEARQAHPLRDGDELILGKMKMRLIFQHTT